MGKRKEEKLQPARIRNETKDSKRCQTTRKTQKGEIVERRYLKKIKSSKTQAQGPKKKKKSIARARISPVFSRHERRVVRQQGKHRFLSLFAENPIRADAAVLV